MDRASSPPLIHSFRAESRMRASTIGSSFGGICFTSQKSAYMINVYSVNLTVYTYYREFLFPHLFKTRNEEFTKMSFSKNSENRVAIVQMNDELRNAQVELLSAQCATDRLRLRFSQEDIARHGQPDVLRKAVATTTTLHDYYSAIEKHGSRTSAVSKSGPGVNGTFRFEFDPVNKILLLRFEGRLTDESLAESC